MLQNKGTIKIEELKNGFTPKWFELNKLNRILEEFKLKTSLSTLSKVKSQGYTVLGTLTILLSMPFWGILNINGLFENNEIEEKKDVFYRTKKNPNINWRSALWAFAKQFLSIVDKNSCSDESAYKCLIFDDSLLEKRGCTIERVSRVWDHVYQKYLLGFKINLMAYWDGKSLLPLDFVLHRERGKNKEKPFGLTKKESKNQYKKARNADSCGQQRVKETDKTKIETAISMFHRAVKQKVVVDYVLMDSWFTCTEFIKAVVSVPKKTIHLIGMYKNVNKRFGFRNSEYTIKQIRNMLGNAKRNRKSGYYYLETVVVLDDIKLKIYFSRKGKHGKWRTFLCTDLSLSFDKMLEIYSIRWTIEVFFKESKQLFALGKEQSTDFDSQIAATTISCMQYLIAAAMYRFEHYESIGGAFKAAKTEIFRSTLSQRIWEMLIELANIISTIFEGADELAVLEHLMKSDETNILLQTMLSNFKSAA